MKNLNLQKLNEIELKNINGGASWAYRIGQLFRLSIMSQGSTGNLMAAVNEFAANEALSE